MNPFLGWAGLAAFGGVIVAAWSYVRAAWQQFVSRLIISFTCEGGLADVVLFMCVHRLRMSRFGLRTYAAMGDVYVRPRRLREMVGYETIGAGGKLCWLGWRPFWLTRSSAIGNDQSDTSALTDRPLKLFTFRFGFDVDAFVLEAIKEFNQLSQSAGRSSRTRYRVDYHSGSAGRQFLGRNGDISAPEELKQSYPHTTTLYSRRFLGWSPEDLGPPIHSRGSAVNALALTPAIADFVEQFERWLQAKEWFLTRGLPWKLGALLHGPPGNGKTALVRALAVDFDLPVHVFDLATLRNDELRRAWSRMLTDLPAIALIEDVDGVFNGREQAKGVELSFDCLLNCIDGVEPVEGLATFVTTNRPETLDSALGGAAATATRPGRIDVSLQFSPLDHERRLHVANRILGDWPDAIAKAVKEGAIGPDSGAQFERRCIEIALARYWKEKIEKTTKDSCRQLDQAIEKIRSNA